MISRFHDCELDDRLYHLRCGGEVVKLTPQVFDVLVYLLHRCD